MLQSADESLCRRGITDAPLAALITVPSVHFNEMLICPTPLKYHEKFARVFCVVTLIVALLHV